MYIDIYIYRDPYTYSTQVPHVSAIAWHTALHAGPALRWRSWRSVSAAKASKAFVPRNVLMRRVQGRCHGKIMDLEIDDTGVIYTYI